MARIGAQHVIADISYRAERIDCTCGAVVTAERDTLVGDRHDPLVLAWNQHRQTATDAPAVVRKAKKVQPSVWLKSPPAEPKAEAPAVAVKRTR